ncbi:MAG: hypothetical protein WC123_05065 [Bacilli bacterium]
MRDNKIKVFYTEKQVLVEDSLRNFSKSPLKPKLLLEHLSKNNLLNHFDFVSNFRPLTNFEFMLAHTPEYVNDFFTGGKLAESNGLRWSSQFANSVRYTNSSLYHAIKNSILNPEQVSFSPTSGFHHASPNGGMGFCTFSGQAISSIKLYKELGKVGCYIDLDGHYGNSIEDTRAFNPIINKAIPPGFNFNPKYTGQDYVDELRHFLYSVVALKIMDGEIDYVVWCHGADSHKDDDLGSRVNTKQWIECADIFWSWIKFMDDLLGSPIPVSCALFGGYRKDDFDSVLNLHTADLVKCLNHLLNYEIEFEAVVKPKPEPKYESVLYNYDDSEVLEYTPSRSYPRQDDSLKSRYRQLLKGRHYMENR